MSKFVVCKFYILELVFEGYFDKFLDFIFDSIFDEFLCQELISCVVVEIFVMIGMVVVVGEVCVYIVYVDIQKIVCEVVQCVGYICVNYGFDVEYSVVFVVIYEQLFEIVSGVDYFEEWCEMSEVECQKFENVYSMVGVGDQGLMFGYVIDEMFELMLLLISFVYGLICRFVELCKDGILFYLCFDVKVQVMVVCNGELYSVIEMVVDIIVILIQYFDDVIQEQICVDMLEYVILVVIFVELFNEQICYFINFSGCFVIGGLYGDIGLIGCKIIVDIYGGVVLYGGGVFFGKDLMKVDCLVVYYVWYVVKNIVVVGLVWWVFVEIVYVIGCVYFVLLWVDIYGIGMVSDEKFDEFIVVYFDVCLQVIIVQFDL